MTRAKVVGCLCASLLLVAVQQSGAQDGAFSGVVLSRRIEVDSNALVHLLGGSAGDREKVFALTAERLLRFREQGGEGVQVREEKVRVYKGILRVDVETSSGASYVLVRPNEGTMEWVRPEERSVVVWRKPKEAARPSPGATLQLEPAGAKTSVAGLTAEAYRAEQGSDFAQVWIARTPQSLVEVVRALAGLTRAVKPNAESFEELVKRAAAPLGIPARVQVSSPKGYVLFELVKVESGEQPAADFAVPPNYQRVSVADLQPRRESEEP
jgi:hypothetical protein